MATKKKAGKRMHSKGTKGGGKQTGGAKKTGKKMKRPMKAGIGPPVPGDGP